MHLTLMLTGSLVPAELAAELAGAAQVPALQQLLAHAAQQTETVSSTGSADADWIATQIFGVAQPAPTAPYAWAALTGTPPTAPALWHADPIHIAVGRDSLIVHELAGASPTEVESDALIAAANETLRDAGCALERAGEKWFLRTETPWSMAPLPLSAVLGQPLEIASPGNDDSGRWTRLHNEIQMRWHDHPMNQARESQGKPPVNALWLHGGGTWRDHPPLRWPRVHSDRADLRGIAVAAGAGVADAAEAVTGDALLVWDDPLAAARAGDWSGWIEAISAVDHRLGALPPATLEIVLVGRHRTKTWIARPSDRLKIWRRTLLAEALAE